MSTKTKNTTPVPKEHAGALQVQEMQADGALQVQEMQADGAWGGEGITNDDITIPKILLMQPMSDLVTDGVAKIGEFRSSLNKELVLGNDKTPVEIIIFGSFKTWIEFKGQDYLRTLPMTPDNISLAQEEVTEDGTVITRDRVINYYCVLAKDVELGEPFPYVLSCRRTSYNAGKDIATHIIKLKMFDKNSASKVFAITSSKETNDKGTFFVMNADVKRDSTETEQVAAYQWYKALSKAAKNVRVDDSDVAKTKTTTTETTVSV